MTADEIRDNLTDEQKKIFDRIWSQENTKDIYALKVLLESLAAANKRVKELEMGIKDRPSINPDCQGCMTADLHFAALLGDGVEGEK